MRDIDRIAQASKAVMNNPALGDRVSNGEIKRASAMVNDKVKHNKAFKEKMVWIK